MAKNYIITIFYLSFVIKDPLKKIEAKTQKSTSTAFWGIIIVHNQPNIGMIGWKLK